SPGSIVLYFPQSKWAITGDVIFKSSIGRTDLVGGNHHQLIDGIRNKVLTLPGDTIVYPGHGDPTTIDREERHNPFV
ncbi:MBL fold metallo-hydrolase, partial [uncultured Muribaculum sp.]